MALAIIQHEIVRTFRANGLPFFTIGTANAVDFDNALPTGEFRGMISFLQTKRLLEKIGGIARGVNLENELEGVSDHPVSEQD